MRRGMSGPALAAWAVSGIAGLGLIALVAASPHRPIYDEAWYLGTLQLLYRDGLSLAFLREFPGAAGPTFTVVFAAVDAFVGLTFPWLRLVNAALLAATAALIWRCLTIAQKDLPHPALTAAMLTLLPTVGVSAGMALTEMPAAFFSVLAVTLLAQSLISRAPLAAVCSIFGGIALGAAILGRQNYLLLLLCLPLAIRWTHGKPVNADLWRVLLFAVFALKLSVPVFVVWDGLVPPLTASSTSGLIPGHIVRGAGYAGFILMLMAPRLFTPLQRPIWLAAVSVLSVPVSFILADGFVPMRSVMQKLFDAQALIFAMAGISLAFSFAAVSFVACFGLHLWRHRNEWLTRLSGAFVLLGLLSNAKITHQFSSRYVFIVLPFLVMAAAPAVRLTRWTWLQMTSAAGISLAALASYYFGR